jgi:pimeloyl-ACP methyl ester carboxylesterase
MRGVKCLTLGVVVFAMNIAPVGHADNGPRIEDVAFKAECDGSEQHYVLLYPEGFMATKSYPMLIALHSHGGDRWQFIKNPRNDNDCRAVRDAAVAHQMLYVSPDYRGKTSWMGPKAEADLLQIIKELKARFQIGKVILAGGSMGGASALTFAAMHPEKVAGVISMNGTANHLEYENFQDAIRESFGGTKARIPQEYKKRSAEYWPERLTMPIGVTVGGQDSIVPPASVIRLANVLKKLQPNVLLINNETIGHDTTYKDGRAACEFVIGKAIEAPAAPR